MKLPNFSQGPLRISLLLFATLLQTSSTSAQSSASKYAQTPLRADYPSVPAVAPQPGSGRRSLPAEEPFDEASFTAIASTALAGSSTCLFLPDEELVTSVQTPGVYALRTFDWDPIAGAPVSRGILGYASLRPADLSTYDSGLEIHDRLSESTTFSTNESRFTIEGAMDLLKFSAEEASANTNSQVTVSNSFELRWTMDFGDEIIDFFGPSLQFSSQALGILLMPDGPAKEALWKQEFGRFVAVGRKMRSNLTMKVSLQQSASTSQAQSFTALKGEYGAVAASASFADLVEERASNSFYDLDLKANGVSVDHLYSHLTNPESIDHPAEKRQFIEALTQLMVANYEGVGVIAIPMSAFPGVPSVSVPPLESFQVAAAAREAHAAMRAVRASDAWFRSVGLQTFLGLRFPDYPAPNKLATQRLAVFAEINDVWGVAQDFVSGLAPSSDLIAEVLDLQRAQLDLDLLLDQIRDHVQQLPPVEVDVTMTNFPGLNGTNETGFILDVRNLALFDVDPVQVVGDMLVIFEDQNCSGYPWSYEAQYNAPNTTAPPQYWVKNLDVPYDDLVPSGPSAGLRDLQIEGSVGLSACSAVLRVRLIDHLQRIGMGHWEF